MADLVTGDEDCVLDIYIVNQDGTPYNLGTTNIVGGKIRYSDNNAQFFACVIIDAAAGHAQADFLGGVSVPGITYVDVRIESSDGLVFASSREVHEITVRDRVN